MRVKNWRKLAALMLAVGMSLGLAACGDTWEGIKEDTSDNTAAVGRGMEKAGEKVEDAAQ
jgi:predicted small secreted protein